LFQGFIDLQVTPRFPEGLTLLAGNGALVDEVRAEYKGAFQQESVLRVDEHSCVSF
jgi:hypothetical protein